MATVPPYDIDTKGARKLVEVVQGTGTAGDYGIDGLFKLLWAYLDPENCPGTQATAADRLAAIETLLASAGTGTARVLSGTNAARLALSPVPNPCFWLTTDTLEVWAYVAGWVQIMDLAGAQTVNGVKTFGSIPVLPASDPTTDNQAARKAYVDTSIANLSLALSVRRYSGI